jgi:hypothetical protein
LAPFDYHLFPNLKKFLRFEIEEEIKLMIIKQEAINIFLNFTKQ